MITDEEVIRIERIVGSLSEGDEELARLLSCSLGRGMVLDRSSVGKVSLLSRPDAQHVRDWLKAALVNEAPWLRNVDDHGQPKKLMKLMSVKDCVAEADKEMRKAATRKVRTVQLPGDEELFAELSEGYYLARLWSRNALVREGLEMQHCLGDGAYDDLIGRDDYQYLSLRDPFGRPHATIEVVGGRISQIQGKQNQVPVRKYLNILVPHIKRLGLVASADLALYCGFVIERSGSWVSAHELYEGIEVVGDYELSFYGVGSLPDSMTVHGNLGMAGATVREVPDNLTVTMDADFMYSHVRRVPGNISVGMNLLLNGSDIEVLPENFSLHWDLNLEFSKIVELPKGLNVGSLLIAGTGIRKLPDDLKVRYSLSVHNGQIEHFPETLSDRLKVKIVSDDGDRIETLGEIRARKARPAA